MIWGCRLFCFRIFRMTTGGEPEAVDEVLPHYSKRSRLASFESGHVNKDSGNNMKRQLIAALLKSRFDEQKL